MNRSVLDRSAARTRQYGESLRAESPDRATVQAFSGRPRNPTARIQPFEHVNYAELEPRILAGAKKNV